MKLILFLEHPISGYWDGGTKGRFEFEIENISKDGKGLCARIGCWDANRWFHVDGKGSEKKILANVKRKFSSKLAGLGARWEYVL